VIPHVVLSGYGPVSSADIGPIIWPKVQLKSWGITLIPIVTPYQHIIMPTNKTINTYKAILVRLMSFIDDQEYNTTDYEFTEQQLLGTLTADAVMRWMNQQTFNNADPPHGHNLNPLVRSSSLAY
jgi:hypothetical protein